MAVVLKKKAEQYGRLTVLSKDVGWRVYGKGKRYRLWWLRCVCGGVTVTVGARVKAGGVRSCGCLKREAAAKAAAHSITHGLSGHPMYGRWYTMIQRCYNPNHADFANYGGRGIYVCDRWRYSVANYIKDIVGLPGTGTEIDREDNDGPYSPENCRWITSGGNNRNRRNNSFIDYNGLRLTMVEWAERIGISKACLWFRLRKAAWPVEAALTLPKGSKLKDWKPCKDTA